ncbi:hypothetical protein QA646_30480 (plasmid) [Rhizobium sp. CB3090]|uniref:hypothetical protein n=1 Tax=Rhizobium sp. CB3090 TaxID=3039156 RepID=UPI0024B13EA4|nr:hypothetical protein [Rhizobium sp. CB3090]WFU13309.1 hypothetical protein QA646_30480 [Rhizobium sp. CB3090]
MANLDVIKASFADMNEQMEIIKKHLPSDRQPQIDKLHGKLRGSQARMLAIQEGIEKRRGAVEGDRFVAPIKYEFRQFVAEQLAPSFAMSPARTPTSKPLPSRIMATRSKSTHGKIARLCLPPFRLPRKNGVA